MKELIKSTRKCIEDKNWYGALVIAITLPDICGKLQYPDKSSGKRYIEWFERYLGNVYSSEMGPFREKHVFLTGEDCYALRCSYLHEGSDIISQQHCRKLLDSFLFMTEGCHCNFVNVNGESFLQLRVDKFCEDICIGVEKWLQDVAGDLEIEKRISESIKIHSPGVSKNGILFG